MCCSFPTSRLQSLPRSLPPSLLPSRLLQVLFRDSSKHRIAPKFTDLCGIHAASLGPKGVAYISPQAGEGRPSVLVSRGEGGRRACSNTRPAAGRHDSAVLGRSSSAALVLHPAMVRITILHRYADTRCIFHAVLFICYRLSLTASQFFACRTWCRYAAVPRV